MRADVAIMMINIYTGHPALLVKMGCQNWFDNTICKGAHFTYDAGVFDAPGKSQAVNFDDEYGNSGGITLQRNPDEPGNVVMSVNSTYWQLAPSCMYHQLSKHSISFAQGVPVSFKGLLL